MASGLLEWSNAIRFTIANDPGRSLFKDQVNNHGFIFLEDYLANILQGASKQDPMIELVKTPGRKKGFLKQPKVVSKLNHSMSSQSVAQDLRSLVDDSAPKARSPAGLHDVEPQSNHVHAIHVPDNNNPPPDFAVPASQRAPLLAPSHSEQKDLSIIAEDDETCDVPHNQLLPSNDLSQESTGERKSDISRSQLPSSGANELVPTETQVSLHIPPTDTALGPSASPPFVSLESNLYSQTETILAVPNTAMPPSSGNPSGHHPDAQNMTVPTSASSQEAVDPNMDAPLIVDDKFGTILYPALPGPIPLRKSIRAPRDPSINAAPSNLATPGATLGAKRTSWLKKAREVKALETTSRSTLAPPPSVVLTSKNLKRKSGETDLVSTTTDPEKEDRRHKSAKNIDSDVASSMREASECVVPEVGNDNYVRMSPEICSTEKPLTEQEGMFDRFKRTVEGLGARVGKSMGKSLGGVAVAAALAEARAAAEARVAERVITKELLTAEGSNPASSAFTPVEAADTVNVNAINQVHNQPRLSVSDLFPPTTSSVKMKSRNGEESPQPSLHCETLADPWNKAPAKSQITTQQSSPTTIRQQCSALSSVPVFNKPPPVFIPPVTLTSGPNLAPQADSQMTRSPPGSPLATHFERLIFENTTDVLDETDTWSTTGKRTIGVHWLSGGGGTVRDDSQTWSTLASQEGETCPVPRIDMLPEEPVTCGMTGIAPSPDVDMDDEYQEEMMLDGVTGDLGEFETTRSESQTSFSSSQSQAGYHGSASKVPGTTSSMSKRGKAEVKKVLQKAAVAAKKQQEENDKKAVRLKEMENRRQLAMQRKLEEEKAKAQEQERKMKEEGDRRKRDREENAEKRPSKLITSSKKDEEAMKKRKVMVVEIEKKESKKPLSKSILKSSTKAPIALSSSTAFNASMQMNSSTGLNLPEGKPQKQPMSLEKGKAKLPPPGFKRPQGVEDDFERPSQLVQIQMAARAKAQLQAAQLVPEPIPSENIDLPDINSEYSDSEDEDRPKTFDPPGWAQSPELLEALHLQSTINPDDIFGTIQPLKMEELFKTRTSRFRARTSSANWTGADRLTAEEEREYSKRMGFR